MKYEELGYSLPDVTAADAATRAIAVLEEVAEYDPACLFYVIQASNILALSGLRALSPYNVFEPNFSQAKREGLRKILLANGHEIVSEDSPYDDPDGRSVFSISCNDRIRDMSQQYKAAAQFWRVPETIATYSDYAVWIMEVQFSLVKAVERNELPKEWLLDWWAPHNIRFGMLLGYPGQAITSFCWDEAEYASGITPPQELTPSIPFQGVYCGTHVNYAYSPRIKDTSTIKAHEALWSEVLTSVYAVFSEERLAQYPEFMAEFARYEAYDGQ